MRVARPPHLILGIEPLEIAHRGDAMRAGTSRSIRCVSAKPRHPSGRRMRPVEASPRPRNQPEGVRRNASRTGDNTKKALLLNVQREILD